MTTKVTARRFRLMSAPRATALILGVLVLVLLTALCPAVRRRPPANGQRGVGGVIGAGDRRGVRGDLEVPAL
jgi:hypothetical protein